MIVLTIAMTVGCSKGTSSLRVDQIDVLAKDSETGRWYSQAILDQGRQLFQRHCVACHGKEAEATADWKTRTATGHYPPPPLNGSAHAWHHPLSVLVQVISDGGAPMGGVMPAWKGVLTEQEMLSTIAAFQHYWPDKIYER